MIIYTRRHVDSLHRMCYNIGMIGSRLIYFKVDLSGTCAMLPVTSPEVTIFTSQKCLLCLLVRHHNIFSGKCNQGTKRSPQNETETLQQRMKTSEVHGFKFND